VTACEPVIVIEAQGRIRDADQSSPDERERK
jgi:hypothetical protein